MAVAQKDRVQELAFARTVLADKEREHRGVSESLRIARIVALSRIYEGAAFLAASNDRMRQQAVDEALLGDESYMELVGDEYEVRNALEGARLQLALAEDAWREYAYGVLEVFAGGDAHLNLGITQAIVTASDKIAKSIADAATLGR